MTDITAKLAEALKDAARSLETISTLSGRATYGNPPIESFMGTFDEVRAYANSRATIASEALAEYRQHTEAQAGVTEALVREAWEAIGDYSVQVAKTGKLAPCEGLVKSMDAIAAALAAAPAAAQGDTSNTNGELNMLSTAPTVALNFANAVPYDDLVTALKLIHHATAPTHEDGAYHEAAFDLADGVVKRINAREAYEASTTNGG